MQHAGHIRRLEDCHTKQAMERQSDSGMPLTQYADASGGAPPKVTRKEFRKFAYRMISDRRYNNEVDAGKMADMFYRMDDPGWWDKSLVGYISTKCLEALVKPTQDNN